MQKVDRDWLAANDAHPHILHLADVLNGIVEHLTQERLERNPHALDAIADGIANEHNAVTISMQATDEATTDGEVEATDPSGDA
ncbi:hypothetical protein EF294_03400 [Gordonia oryzae]|uniref:Uncharacterized protein n=1 Tax=Gordonia oryzae TaxID=2487349 RepID=A0A3N4GTZ4_9ACTN|nr:hypothetical protein [Gordonia oryzae]RPA65795.1 hypothetical protein EF294_03400 [Gordonia oryzae]